VNINLVNEISKTLGYKRTDLIEKDMLLQQLLQTLSSESFFSKNFIFKGGTCLIKAYAGYFRFSEDIDFTKCRSRKPTIFNSGMNARERKEDKNIQRYIKVYNKEVYRTIME